MSQALLQVEGLSRRFLLGRSGWLGARRALHAVQDLHFHIDEGQTLGLVGESGCGKSTTGRLVAGLDRATDGRVLWQGREIVGPGRRVQGPAWRALRREIQVVWQNPLAALDPRISVGEQVAEPLLIHEGAHAATNAAKAMISAVGLAPELAERLPHELSGGQLQRVVIARALVLQPRLVVCDEPVSALDVSVQAQVVNLLAELQQRRRIAYLFISHDLKVVRHLSHRVAVMYLGRIVEIASREALFASPQHPYTQALIAAVPVPDPRRRTVRSLLPGEPPSPIAPPPGCAFHPRCARASERCRREPPPLVAVAGPGAHFVACHHPGPAGS